MKEQQRTRRRIWPPGLTLVSGLALVAAAAVASVALGSGSGTQAASKKAVDTKTLIVAVSSDIQNLDPTLSSADVATQELLTNVYDWLIDYKVVTKGGLQYGSPND